MRDRFSNRLGFILISAGCAIGIGNVWRFPYIVGQCGGAPFVLIYLFFSCYIRLASYGYGVFGRSCQSKKCSTFF